MKTPVVGIIGAANERHCLYVAAEIERNGARPLILDNSPDLPFPLTMAEEGVFYYKGENLDVVGSFYLRALFLPIPAFPTGPIERQLFEEGYRAYARERERYAAWLSWMREEASAGKPFVNAPDAGLWHFVKPHQLRMLRRAGLPVPATLVTSSSEALSEFWRKYRRVVYKPVAGGAHCRLLTEADLAPERLERLSAAPVLFQEYVPGADLRVFVLDGRVIAAFRVEGEDGVDYRIGQPNIEPYPADESVADIAVRACRALGLVFAGVDLKLAPDGRIVLLECNPSPMFEGFDRAAPVTVCSQLAAYLIDMARSGTARAVVNRTSR